MASPDNFDKKQLEKDGSGFLTLRSFAEKSDLSHLTNTTKRIQDSEMNILFNDTSTNDALATRENGTKGMAGSAQTFSEHAGRRICHITRTIQRNIMKTSNDRHSWELLEEVVKILAERCSQEFGVTYEVVGPFLIRSLRFCPQQLLHCDHDPSEIVENSPRITMLVFLHDSGSLVIYNGGHNVILKGSHGDEIDRQEAVRRVRHLSFEAGQILLFRQDVPHKGAATQGLNERMFFELIPTGSSYTPGTKTKTRSPKPGDGSTFYIQIK